MIMKLLSLISLIFLLLGLAIHSPHVEGSQITNSRKTSTPRQSKVLIQNHHCHCYGSGRWNDVLKSLAALGKEVKGQFDRLRKEMKTSTQKHDQQLVNVVARVTRLEKEVKTVKMSQVELKEEMKGQLVQLNEYVNASRMEMKKAKREHDRQFAALANGVERVKKSQMEVKKKMKGQFDQLNKNVDASRMEMKKATWKHDHNLTIVSAVRMGKFEKGVKILTTSQAELKKEMKGMLEQLHKDITDYGMEMKNATAKCWRLQNNNSAQQGTQLKLCACNATSLGAAAGGRLQNSRFTASSVHDNRYFAKYGRLNYHKPGALAWAPKGLNNKPHYLQVDLGALRVICAVATQGCPGPHHTEGPEWTTTYKISLSSDGST